MYDDTESANGVRWVQSLKLTNFLFAISCGVDVQLEKLNEPNYQSIWSKSGVFFNYFQCDNLRMWK